MTEIEQQAGDQKPYSQRDIVAVILSEKGFQRETLARQALYDRDDTKQNDDNRHSQKDILNDFVVLKERADQHKGTKVDGAGDTLRNTIHFPHSNTYNYNKQQPNRNTARSFPLQTIHLMR